MGVEPTKFLSLLSEPFYAWLSVILLMAAMSLDVATGLAAAVVEKKLSSKVGYKGMMRKMGVLFVVALAYLFELQIMTIPESLRPSMALPLAKIACAFFFIMESLSVLENVKRCGVPLPDFLSKSLVETMKKLNAFGQTQETIKVETKITHEPASPAPPPHIILPTDPPPTP